MDASYIAGFVDGEGHIGICTHKMSGKKYKGKIYVQIRPIITLVNTDAGVLIVIQNYLTGIGCSSSLRCRKMSNANWRQVYELEIAKVDSIIILLETIHDYLVIKKPQCELMLEFCRQRKNKLFIATKYRGYTTEQIEIADKLRSLNGGKITGGNPMFANYVPDNIKIQEVPHPKLPLNWS